MKVDSLDSLAVICLGMLLLLPVRVVMHTHTLGVFTLSCHVISSHGAFFVPFWRPLWFDLD